MKTRKRLGGLLLALLLLFSLLPAAALAAEEEPPADEDTGFVESGGGEGECEHEYLVTVVPPTCTEQGCTLHSCTLCEYSYTDEETEIDPENHDYQETVVPATCTERGYTLHSCSRCGDSFADEYTDPDPKNHTPVEVEALPATEEAPGHEAGVICSACRAVLSGCEEIPQLEPKREEPEDDGLRITVQPEDAPIAEGEAVFTVEAEAEEAPQYQWERLDDSAEYEDDESWEDAWTALEGETESTLRITGLSGFDALAEAAVYLYRCRVTAGEASVTTKPVRLALEEQKLDDTVITGFAAPEKSEYEWEYKPTLAQLRAALPEELDVLLGGTVFFTEDAEGAPLLLAVRDAGEKTLPVVWICGQNYDEALEVFDFFPTAEDYKLAEGLRAPGVKVRVDGYYDGPLDGVIPDGERSADEIPIVGDGGGRKRGMSNEKYNAYELGLLPPLRDQGQEGACWAFSTLGTVETDMIHDGLINVGDSCLDYGLSESYLAYRVFFDPPAGTFRNGTPGDRKFFSGDYLGYGGTSYLAESTLQSGLGLVWEAPGDYDPGYVPTGEEQQAAQVTAFYEINPNDRAGIKAAIRAHGSVTVSIYFSYSFYSFTHNSFYSTVTSTNHSVMIVGWDDTFPKENFMPVNGSAPKQDGAWLVRNSWGGDTSGTGDQYCVTGYFWVSYDDVSSRIRAMTACDVEQNVYQYCYAYDTLPYPNNNQTIAANTPVSVSFQAYGDEAVTAVGIQTNTANLHGTLTVSCGERSVETEVWTSHIGFYLLNLSQPLTVSADEEVIVTLCFDTEGQIDYEDSYDSNIGALLFYPQRDGAGYTIGSGESAVTIDHDLRLKLYTVDSTASPAVTPVTGITLEGDDLETVTSGGENPVVTGYKLALNSGEAEQLKAVLTPAGADNRITWSSSNATVAKVDGGLVTAASPGTAVITAKALSGASVSCTVTVTGVAVTEVRLTASFAKDSSGRKLRVFNENSLSGLNVGPDFDLSEVEVAESYAVLPANASNKDVYWTSSNPAVLEVNENSGVGHFRGNGETLLTVTSKENESLSDCCVVRVDLNEYTVTYNANKGENAPAAQKKTQFFPLWLSFDEPTRDGYVFLGWATSESGNVRYLPGGVYKGNADLTLYAVWGSSVTVEELEGQACVFIDGAYFPVGEGGSIPIPEGAKIVETFDYHYSDSSDLYDPHLCWPTGLKVWKVTWDEAGKPTVTRLSELDDVMQYAGFSIRYSGVNGIRMITSVPQSKKEALKAGALADYTLEEYGTLIAFADSLGYEALTLENSEELSFIRKAYAYKKGVADPVFNVTNGMDQYTNVLINFSDAQVPRDLIMCSYMILSDKSGQTVCIYGGEVQRSIGYVAYQNHNAFAPHSAAYEFVWNLIRLTYGDQYDDLYIR